MPDITYVGKSEGDYFELFHLLADGDASGSGRRPVMEVLVDPEDKIWVSGVAGYGVTVPQETKGTVHRHTDEELEAAGIDSQHVCLGAVMSYVVPRVATLMARVYCPATTPDLKLFPEKIWE